MSGTTRIRETGIGFCGVLFLIFLVLKLTGTGPVASWSWVWITAPLWAPFTLFVSVFIFLVIIGFLVTSSTTKKGDRR